VIFLSKLLTSLVLPPGCFIIVLLFLVIYVPRRFKVFPFIVMFFLYAFSTQPVSDFLLKPLENAYPPLSDEFSREWPQAIVVLGGGTVQGSPEVPSGQDTLTADALKRVVYSLTLKDTFPVPYIFSGGKVFDYEQETEAAVAQRLFMSLGLPPERFKAEDKSRNTWENAREVAFMGLEKVIVVTSAYHVKRSVYCFERLGMSVIAAPTDYKTMRGQKYDILSFLPSMSYLRNTYTALHEYLGLAYYVVVYRNRK
jgi:uncharacterized SAM-binding protein YcdF (DUF218 family)